MSIEVYYYRTRSNIEEDELSVVLEEPDDCCMTSNKFERSHQAQPARQSEPSTFYDSPTGPSVSSREFRADTSQQPRLSASANMVERPPGPSQQVSNRVFRPSGVSVIQNRLAGARLWQILGYYK